MAENTRKHLSSRMAKVGAGILAQMVGFQGSTVLTNVLLARGMPPATFGLLSVAMQTLNAAGQTAQLATGFVGARFLGQTYDEEPGRAVAAWKYCKSIGLKSGLIASVVLFLGASEFSNLLFGNFGNASLFQWAAVGSFLMLASQQSLQGLTALELVNPLIAVSLLSGVAYTVFVLVGKSMGGVQGAMIGIALSYIVTFALVSFFELKPLKVAEKIKVSPADAADIKSQLFPAAVAGFIILPSTWLLSALLTSRHGTSAAGLFAAATQLRLLLMVVPQVLSSAGIALINRLERTANRADAAKVSTFYLLGSSIIVSIIGALIAPSWMHIFGSKYHGALGPFWFMLPAVILESGIQVVRQRLQRRAGFWELLLTLTLPWQFGVILFALFLIGPYGAAGAAMSYTLGLCLGLTFFGLSKHFKVDQRVQASFVRKADPLTKLIRDVSVSHEDPEISNYYPDPSSGSPMLLGLIADQDDNSLTSRIVASEIGYPSIINMVDQFQLLPSSDVHGFEKFNPQVMFYLGLGIAPLLKLRPDTHWRDLDRDFVSITMALAMVDKWKGIKFSKPCLQAADELRLVLEEAFKEAGPVLGDKIGDEVCAKIVDQARIFEELLRKDCSDSISTMVI